MTSAARALADALAPVEPLGQEIRDPRAAGAELERRVAELTAEDRALRDQLDESRRQAARQVAPSRRRDSQEVPEARRERPGRRKGHPGAHRPVPERVVEPIEVPLPACPHCGGAVEAVEPIEPSIEGIPPVRPRVTRLVTDRGRRPDCGEVRSTHPLKTSEATGAAGAQLGPRAQALAVALRDLVPAGWDGVRLLRSARTRPGAATDGWGGKQEG
jgi:hypothetical protein